MNTAPHQSPNSRRHSLSGVLKQATYLLAATVLTLATPAAALTIDFNTRANGNPFIGMSDSFMAGEYALSGLSINDSDPSVGSTFVNLTNAGNVGTPISGYYLNVGAFTNRPPAAVAFDFGAGAQNVQFDFATPTGDISVFAFGPGGFLGAFLFSGSSAFLNQAGFGVEAGSANVFGLGTITSLLIQAPTNQALIIDNLNFAPVPEPSTYLMVLAGLGLLVGFARRRSRQAS